MLQEGLLVTVVGLVVVFATLWILSGVLSAMKLFSGVESRRTASQEPRVHAEQTMEPQAAGEMLATDDLELIAVISAAVAVFMGRDAGTIRVASIQRAVDLDHGWAAAGRHDVIDSRI